MNILVIIFSKQRWQEKEIRSTKVEKEKLNHFGDHLLLCINYTKEYENFLEPVRVEQGYKTENQYMKVISVSVLQPRTDTKIKKVITSIPNCESASSVLYE